MVTLSDAPVVEFAIHEDSAEIIIRRDFAEYARDDRRSGGFDHDPGAAVVEAIVFDTEKLLDVLGEILVPAVEKIRTAQFSMARFKPVLNRMPFDCRRRFPRWSGRAGERCRSRRH